MLQCEAKGEKPIVISWSKNNVRLDAILKHYPRYSIRGEFKDAGVLSTLSIQRTQRGDSAIFTCEASNAFGSDDTFINLIIQEKPKTTLDTVGKSTYKNRFAVKKSKQRNWSQEIFGIGDI